MVADRPFGINFLNPELRHTQQELYQFWPLHSTSKARRVIIPSSSDESQLNICSLQFYSFVIYKCLLGFHYVIHEAPNALPVNLRVLLGWDQHFYLENIVPIKALSQNLQRRLSIFRVFNELLNLTSIILCVSFKCFLYVFRCDFDPVSPNILYLSLPLGTLLYRELRVKVFLVQSEDQVFAERPLWLRIIYYDLVVARRQKVRIDKQILVLNFIV